MLKVYHFVHGFYWCWSLWRRGPAFRRSTGAAWSGWWVPDGPCLDRDADANTPLAQWGFYICIYNNIYVYIYIYTYKFCLYIASKYTPEDTCRLKCKTYWHTFTCIYFTCYMQRFMSDSHIHIPSQQMLPASSLAMETAWDRQLFAGRGHRYTWEDPPTELQQRKLFMFLLVDFT